MSKYSTIFIITFICFSITACVTGDRSINGGPEDETPPRLNKIINKGGDALVLIFDENINLSNQSEIVTNFEDKLTYMVKKNKLEIKGLPSGEAKQLIYFNSSIQDLNENNVLTDYIYATNTGIDTFQLSGKISIPLFPDIEKKIKNCYVLMVKPNVNRTDLNNRYLFNFNKTNKEGDFTLDFIPNPSGYDLFSFIDNNNNGKPDTGDFAGFYKNSAFSDSNNNKSIYLNYIGRNLLFKDTTENGTIRQIFFNPILHMINNQRLTNEKYIADTLFNYTNVTDTFIVNNKTLTYSDPCEILTKISKDLKLSYSKASIKGNLIELNDSSISKDTFTYVINGQDTLSKITILKNLEESELVFMQDSSKYNSKQKYVFIKGSNTHYIYKLERTLSIKLKTGAYQYFIFEDNNSNGKYDPISLDNFQKGDNVIKGLKDIDIMPKIDVEIGL